MPLAAVQTHEQNNIPDIVTRWQHLTEEKGRKRTDQSFFVPREEIVAKAYDLSINRYRETEYEAFEYESPQHILNELDEIEQEILKGMADLRELVG